MSKVYVFLADGFEEIEGLTVVDLLRRAGEEVETVSIMGRKMIEGSHKIKVEADALFEETDFTEGKVQDEFVRFYMPLLAKAYLKKGVEMDPKGFIGAVWKGYEAMVKNDGSKTNREAFWSYIDEFLPLSVEESEAIADAFYEDEFNQAKCTTQPTPLSDMVIKEAKKKGIEVYLATNPIFPRCATMNRIDWAGLDPEDFKIITTYEDHVYCKPNPEYFRQILEQFELDPSECLMVGNDVEEDLAIRALGVPVFLITDTMENKKNLPIDSEYQGSMEELLEFVKELPEV